MSPVYGTSKTADPLVFVFGEGPLLQGLEVVVQLVRAAGTTKDDIHGMI